MVARSEYVIAAVGLLLGLTACTPATTATPSAIVTPTPSVTIPSVTPSPTPTWSTDQQAAVNKVKQYYRVAGEVMSGERSANDLAKFARDPALGEAVRYYNTLFGNGLKEDGTVDISELEPSAVRTSGKRPAVAVQLCQDTTRLQVLDKKGDDVLEAGSKKVSPMVVTVQRWGDEWFVTDLGAGKHAC